MAKSYTIDPAREPEIPIILHWFARFYMWLTGWKVVGHMPADKKMMITAGPHTANLDGWLMVLTAWTLRVRFKWMVKAELTRGFIGWFVRAAGGVGIDRSASYNAVEQAVNEFKSHERFLLAIAPEGTRKKSNHWKTGFYWIALGAGVPIKMGLLDYGRKVVDITQPLVHLTGDIDEDMQIFFDAYAPIQARYPEKVSDHFIRPSGKRNLNNPEELTRHGRATSTEAESTPAEAPHVEAPDK